MLNFVYTWGWTLRAESIFSIFLRVAKCQTLPGRKSTFMELQLHDADSTQAGGLPHNHYDDRARTRCPVALGVEPSRRS